MALIGRASFLLLLLAPCLAWCQLTNLLYPDLYTRYDATMYLVNPGYVASETSFDLSAFYKFQTGAFKEVSTLAFSAAKTFRNENDAAHSLRLSVFNEKQGPYISSPRGYAAYAYELPLAEETFLSAGLSLGAAGISYTGVSSTGNLNVYMPDGAAGLALKYRTLHLGAAGLQILNSQTKPYYGALELKRYYHFHISHEVELDENWKWKYYALYRLLPAIPNEVLAGTSLFFSNAIGLGAVVRSNSGISVYGELALDNENNRLSIVFNYNSSFFQLIPAFQNSIELGVGYRVK